MNATERVPATEVRILVVDDNRDMLRYIQTMLSPYYQLQIAQNGLEALNLLATLSQEHLPNLIVSDIMMPEVDGLAFTHELRTNPAWRLIPVVLLTARVDLESRLQALQLGVADYLTKPFYEAELLARIRNLLRRADEQSNWQETVDEGSLSLDGDWLQWLQDTIRANLTNSLFTVKRLAAIGHLSERQLYRRTKALTGLSPSQFIQEVRLQIAQELLERQPDSQVKVIAYQVGYQNPSYFIQLYRERFGINPGERLRQSAEEPEVDA